MAARELDVPTSLKRRLLHLRLLTGTETPAEVDANEVAAVEKALGCTLEDPLLAVVANGDAALARFEVRLRNLPAHTEEFRASGGPRGMIGIGRHAEMETVIGAPLRAARVCFVSTTDAPMREEAIETWLDELVGAEIEALRDEKSDAKARTFRKVTDADVEAFLPAVVESAARRRITHGKFGEGEVLRELDGGQKLEIRFDDGSTKTLLARFVSTLDNPE